MAESKVRLPSGVEVVIKHKDEASEEDVLKFAFNEYVTNQDPGTKIGSSIAQGIDTLQQSYGSSLEGLGEILDAESLQQLGGDIVLKNQAEIDARLFRESQAPTDQSQVAKALDYVSELAGQSAPQMATAMGGAAIGGAIGTLGGPLAPLTIPAGAFLGGFISNMPYFYGSNRERQKEAIEKGYKTEVDEGAAMLAAIPQSSLDAIVSAVGAKFIATPAMKMSGGFFTKVAKGSAAGSIIEVPTEIGQTVLERAQAGLPLDDDEAISEYIDAGVGGAVLGGLFGGAGGAATSVRADFGKDSAVGTGKTKKSDLKKEVEDRPALEVPRTVQIEYKELDGQVRVFPLAVTEGQDPMAAAEEALAGRYDPAFGLTVTDQSQPVGPEQELDLPDQAPDPTQEQVPVQPEAAVPTPEQAPAEQVLPEVVPQVVPATEQAPEAAPVVPEQAPAVRGNFRISPRMAKSKPRYRGQPVAYGSELELAVYMATAKGKNASKVRSELIEAGYSPAEINAMSKEVRAQMKKGYNPNSKKPISVAIAQDVTAEASGVDRLSMSFKDVTKRTPEIQEQAKILRENIKAGDREQSRAVAQAADDFKPVQSYDFVPAPESNSEMRNALNKDKVNKLNAPVKDGAPVAVRLDIPAYVSTGTWVPVVHEQTSSFRPGTPMSYQATAVVDGATLGIVSDIAVSGIAAGKAKSTIATIKGNLKKVTPTQAKKMADKALKDPSYVQVGMDPERRGYFYNRETMQEVVAGDQAIQIGPLVLVKNPQYGATPSNEWLSLGPDVVAEAAPLKAKAKKAKKVTRDYDLLSSPFISNYSGPGPTDTSVPDYGSFHYVVSNPQQQELNAAIASGAVDNLADQVANEAAAMMNDPAIAAGIGWYGRMRQRLSQIFGNDLSIFTQLLGTTSAQTPVETNFRFSVDLYNRFKAGEFDANIKEYLKLYGQMKAGTLGDLLLKDKVKNSKGVLYTPEMIKKSEPSALLSSAAEHYNLEPTQTSGKKYGTNSYPALKALAQVWFNERLSKDKMTPKTPQFTMNLNGESLEATIDVWAARLLRRVIYAGQADSRILPSQETAVNNPDFALGQLVFRRAAQKLNMNPDDLQALVWFGEKQIWDRNGWTGAAGALKSSFDEPADVFYPVDGSTRSEADANLILDFLAKERLVKRDIEFPDAVAKTRQNENRKEYDKFLRQRVISDYLKSRGSGAVYESSSVESNRKRQVTRSINRLSSYTGKVSYKNGTGKEPKGSLKVVKLGPVLGENRFARIAKANKDGNKFGSSVDVFKASDYKGYDLIITSSERGESVTIAISPDGELSSVTKSSNATAQDVDAAFDMAISTGKVKFLNGFETVLPIKYASYGFTPVARLKFNPEFQPDGWSTQTYRNFNGGQPDVVFMRFDGTVGSEYDRTGFPEVDTYEEGVRLANQEDVTAQAAQPEVEDRGPRDTYDNGGQVQDAIEQEFDPIGEKINVKIVMRMKTDYVARYNATRGIIEYNPMLLLKRSKAGIRAAMREEIIHAAMHQVLMVSARKKFSMAEGGKVWTDFFGEFGKSLTDAERSDIKDVYQDIKPEDYVGYGSEYSRAVIQNLLYGEFSEQYQMVSQGGPAWNTIVKLLRSVQAYMAKVLGPMIKTNPEAAQVIVDSVELLKAVDPSIRPKSQDVVAQAYDAVDKNTAKENTEAGERVGQDASERIREERKWFDGAFRKTASKYLTPVITRLNRIHPMFGRILQNLDSAIRMRSMGYRKQTEMFFNKLNAVKGAEFQELKQLIFFSPTPEEANLPSNKAKMQRRDALLHKHGLLNMYRLDVQPILEEIYTEYTALGMPKIGYLEDYFPRVIKDLEGLIKSYGHKTKRTFELLVNEENIRRSELKDKDGNPAPLPEMQETELGRFFQDFLQGKFRLDLNGVKLPGNVKAREIQLIPEDKLKFYDEPGVAFGKYTTNMARAIESFKVVGDTKKGEGRLLGELGKLTEELFTAGQIDQADASEVKSLTELITSQFQAENQILKSLGTLTYMATLINPGPVLVQIMDLYKVALYRGLGGVVSGTYRTVTGNRRFDIERDFGIAKTQLSAEFEDPSFLTKALDFGLSRLVPFRQMDTAMKHASIEAAYDDFVKKAKAPVGSKKYQQLLDELTVTMGREDALKAISDLRLDKAMESTLVKEALLAELLQRQPLTYLQVPEGYQTDPSKRLFYKLSTFMLLDLNYNRQEFMNDLGGPGKTLQQRTVALRRLAYMATLLTMFGLPSDLLDDWIAGKDTYIPEHVMNNMLGMFGLSRYTTSRALNKGAVESVIQRFTPPAINIMIDGEQSLRSWVKGDKELFDIKSWRNSPLSDVWYYRTGGGVESQRKYQKKQRKEGITPTFDR